MLEDIDAVANVAVKDLAVARKFYEGVLGLRPLDSHDREVVVYRTGATRLNVYRSSYAGTNKATAVTWGVGDQLEPIVRDLKTRGVRFEHYDMPHTVLEGDVHRMGDMKVAWFKDPDGNILNVINR
jgi:catechol 2,3-dioxygenase-like lactoylglutathione lyase family enzyme